MQPTLLLLAAGMGSRYGGLKQLDAMGPSGQTMIDYAVLDAMRAGFGKIVFVIRKDFESEFREKIGQRYEDRIAVEYAFQDLEDLPGSYTLPKGRTKPWGTAHAVRAARDVIAEPFAVINADDFYGREAYAQMATHLQTLASSAKGDSSGGVRQADTPRLTSPGGVSACRTPAAVAVSMVGYTLGNTLSPNGTVNRGICQIEDDELQSVEEFTTIGIDADDVLRGDGLDGKRIELKSDAVVSMNFWGFSPALFAHLEAGFEAFLAQRASEMKSEYYLPSLVDQLIKQGRANCPVLQTDSPWFGVTYPEDKARVVESIAKLTEAGLY